MGSLQPDHRKERWRRRAAAVVVGLCFVVGALADPRPFRQYPAVEYFEDQIELPTDFREPAEWVFARLMFPSVGMGSQWKFGATDWTIDYPKADRHITEMVRRLTVLDARSVEQPVDLDDGDDIFYWPWLYAVEVGTWELTDDQAAKLREYLLRGGFLMVDDFHGSREWEQFVDGMRRVFPEYPIVDLEDDDPIFHTFWELEEREQIPGAQFLYYGRTYEDDGYVARWRGIYDDEGRLDGRDLPQHGSGRRGRTLGHPNYPERWSAIAMRTFVNYVVYAMTH